MEEKQDEVEALVTYYLEQSKKTRKLIAISSIMTSALGIFLLAYWMYVVINGMATFSSVALGILSSIGLILVAYLMWRNEKKSERATKEIFERYKTKKTG